MCRASGTLHVAKLRRAGKAVPDVQLRWKERRPDDQVRVKDQNLRPHSVRVVTRHSLMWRTLEHVTDSTSTRTMRLREELLVAAAHRVRLWLNMVQPLADRFGLVVASIRVAIVHRQRGGLRAAPSNHGQEDGIQYCVPGTSQIGSSGRVQMEDCSRPRFMHSSGERLAARTRKVGTNCLNGSAAHCASVQLMSRVMGPAGSPAFLHAFFRLYTKPIACHLRGAHSKCLLELLCSAVGRLEPLLSGNSLKITRAPQDANGTKS